MITFRLSAGEYDRCREVCHLRGIESVSQMARAALGKFLRDPDPSVPTLEMRVIDLEGRLRLLSLELKQLGSQNAPNRMDNESSPNADPEIVRAADHTQ